MEKHIIVFLSLFIATISCVNNKNTPNNIYELQLADKYMTTNPKLSLQILDSLNNTDCDKDHYYALLYAQAKYRNYIKVDNDSLITVALQYYSTCKDINMKARAFLVAAQIYRDMGQDDTALKYIHKAAGIVIDDNWTKCYIYYIWGRILQHAKDINSSTEKLELSLYFAKELNDTSLIINRLHELSYNYMAEEDYATALERLNCAIDLASLTKSYRYLSLLHGRKSLIFFMLENYREALAYINNAMLYNKYLGHSDSLSNINYKGKVLLKNNMPDSARFYIEQSKDTSSIYSQNVYYNSMSMLKESLGNYKDALKYEKQHSKCLLRIAAEIENDKIAELNRQYDSARTEAENNRLKIENQRKSILVLILAIIAITVIFATYAYIARHRKKARAAMQQQLDQFNKSIKQMQQHENAIMAMQLKAREEAMTYARSLNDREKELGEVKELLADMRNYLLQNDKAVKKIYEILKCNSQDLF